jgi:hypothetical protein|tara:strand:- start:613 stop:732 length:120 start_codon:yes stop_codon:yes gene_type:complete
MKENLIFYAWFYVIGIIGMSLFIRFYLYKKRQKKQQVDK